MFSRNYLIIYDIHKNKIRRKVVKLLEMYGIRVQYSSFECCLSHSSKKRLKGELSKIIDTDDSVRMYRMPERTERVNGEDVVNSYNKKTVFF